MCTQCRSFPQERPGPSLLHMANQGRNAGSVQGMNKEQRIPIERDRDIRERMAAERIRLREVFRNHRGARHLLSLSQLCYSK